MLARNTYPFTLTAQATLAGPAVDVIRKRTVRSQYVLFGENHHDAQTPLLAQALYRWLRTARGFSVLVVEQDPLAIEAIMTPALRGDPEAIAALSRRHPTHLGFSSDQDIALLADASRSGPVWGVEQAQGSTRYLEELLSLAPAALKPRIEDLLQQARRLEKRESPGAFLHDDATTLERLERMQKDLAAAPGSRAALLIDALVETARIYSYNRRANAGEFVGLYNNTEREALFKRHFVRRYREAGGDKLPIKAMFKFGSWHMYRGKSPGQAYTIASFAHESAIWNDMDAYGIYVMAYGGYTSWADNPVWLKPLLPDELPTQPVLIDLQPLKPYARVLRESVPEGEQWQLRDLLQGFDAIVILPDSRKASWDLTGFPVP